MNYEYAIANPVVIDGDTVDVDIDLGFDVWLHKQRIRLYGIDAPETRTRNLEEKAAGLKAKEYVQDIFDQNECRLLSLEYNRGKFGRILGTFLYADGTRNLNQDMLDLGLADAYFGGKR